MDSEKRMRYCGLDEILVSVIVPVYNTEKYIDRAIKSIRRQQHNNLELILVDDGSSDRSGEICDWNAKEDSRIKVIHKRNGGVSSARNKGLEEAKGKYIMFVDSDDEIPQDSVIKQLNKIESENCDVVMGALQLKGLQTDKLFGGVEKRYTCQEFLEEAYLNKGLKYLLITSVAVMFRNEDINKYMVRFNEKMKSGEDGIFVLDYLKHVKSVYVMEDICYYYYTFPIAERVNSINNIYLDEYFFHIFYYEYLSELIGNSKKHIMLQKRYIDVLIPSLLIFEAYGRHHLSAMKLHEKLKYVVNRDSVYEAVKVYKRISKNHSWAIPKCIKYKNAFFLLLALRFRNCRCSYNRDKGVNYIFESNAL